MQKCCFVFGTHAEAVKFAPLVHEFRQRNVHFFMVHTGQQHSPALDDARLQELDIPAPDYAFQHTSWVVNVMDCVQQFTIILRVERPTVVLVQEETNATLVASLAAKEMDIPVLPIKTGYAVTRRASAAPEPRCKYPPPAFHLVSLPQATINRSSRPRPNPAAR